MFFVIKIDWDLSQTRMAQEGGGALRPLSQEHFHSSAIHDFKVFFIEIFISRKN